MFLRSRTGSKHDLPRPIHVDCSWCGSGVPLESGEFSGVCIDCGTVMFRPHGELQGTFSLARYDIRGAGGSLMPTPA